MSRKDYMRLAFALAKKGLNNTGSNPMVGAVLVKNGLIIGKGYHVEFGGLHAEANAIKEAERKGFSVKNAKLFVTLEPCYHKSNYWSCSDQIIKSGIKIGRKTYGSPTLSDQASLSCLSLKMGPGVSTRSHTADEYIYVDEIKEGIEIYIKMLKLFLIK